MIGKVVPKSTVDDHDSSCFISTAAGHVNSEKSITKHFYNLAHFSISFGPDLRFLKQHHATLQV